MMTRIVSIGGRLHWVAKAHWSAELLFGAVWGAAMLLVPFAMPISGIRTWQAITPAASATITTRVPLAIFLATVSFSTRDWKTTKAATKKLKMTPLSAPSITAIPTARPARTALSQRLPTRRVFNAARANKNIASVSAREPRPQQVLEQKFTYRAAAR